MYHHQSRSDDAGAKKIALAELRKQLERGERRTAKARRGDDAGAKKIAPAELS